MEQYGLSPEDIVFEITERNSIEDEETFRQVIRHYQSQTFQIAIDDFGNGYAGMNRICALEPEYLKIDMAIVRDVDHDNLKKSLVESMIQFCEKANIRLIAEGIETREELRTLIKMGIPFGQGYYIGRPETLLQDIAFDIKEYIRGIHANFYTHDARRPVLGNVGNICRRKYIIAPDKPAKEVYYFMQQRPAVTEVTIVDEEERVLGMLTRSEIMTAFGGMYGYDLSAKKKVYELMDEKALTVDYDDSIEKVSRMALMRGQRTLYDSVVVTKSGLYFGVITVKDLLEAAITIQVNRAVEANPLTGLPGNSIIDERVKKTVCKKTPFSVIYIDLDNFKAYNDAYSFSNGDLMIKALAESMEENCINGEFLGHIGGDDFVIITNRWDVESLLEQITSLFQEKIVSLYSDEDYQRGFIVSKNRKGQVEQFPIVTLSMAVITNREKCFTSVDEFSEELAAVKKKSKQMQGNSYAYNNNYTYNMAE